MSPLSWWIASVVLVVVVVSVALLRWFPRRGSARSKGMDAHRVVVVGGGFGGLRTVKALRRAGARVTLIDRRNFHLFQPLLYQVATSGLSPGEIATPLRRILKGRGDVGVALAEVTAFDLENRRVLARSVNDEASPLTFAYDTLVVAAGACDSYFGNDAWREFAPGMKSIEDALEIRRRILTAFESAELEPDAARRADWLTFVVVGGGPTGVELAGQIGEISRDTLRKEFRAINPEETRIILVEGAERLLGAFHPSLSATAARELGTLGITVRTGCLVNDIGVDHVVVEHGGESERIPARTVVWAAGVAASPLARVLAEASGGEIDRNGRIVVRPDLTLPGRDEVFAIGDMVALVDPKTGRLLPGVSPVAMQQGRHVAATVRRRLAGDLTSRPFRYTDKGNMATIGRLRAVVEVKGLRFGGVLAWFAWLGLHLTYLVGFQNRLIVLFRWSGSFVTRNRGARLITGEPRSPDRDGDSGTSARRPAATHDQS